jgi:large repetitive protein
LFQNGVAIGTTTSNSSGNWTFDNTKTTLPAGSYVFTAIATDLAGNVSQVSNSYNVLIETHCNAPVISGVTTQPNGQNPPTLVVEGTAEAQSQVQIYLGNSLVGTVNADGNGNWNWNSNLPNSAGSYSFTAVATDLAGNVSTPASLNLQIGGPNAPTAQVQNLSGSNVLQNNNGNITAISTPTLTGNATAGSLVTIVDGDVILGTALANAQGNWTFTCSTLNKGQHNIAVEATNSSGFTSLLSSVLTFQV